MPVTSSEPITGITAYGCARDEAALFDVLAPRFGVRATITEAAVTEDNVGPGPRRPVHQRRPPDAGHEPRSACARPGRREVHLHQEHRQQPHRRGVRRALGIRVENVTYSPDSVADYTLMLMLMAVRNAKSVLCRADGHDYRLHEVRGRELRDLTVGVVGDGHIGTAVIGRLRGSAAGCWPTTTDRRPPPATFPSMSCCSGATS